MDIAEANIEDDITYHYISRLRHHEDELGLIIKGHLLIEFIINLIIQKRCKSPNVILEDHRTYSFSVKLQLVYSMDLLPKHIYLNIRKVNKIRNQLAHNLELDTDKLDYKLFNSSGVEVIVKKPKRNMRYPARHYIKMLCFATLSQLRNHFLSEFGELPKY